MTDGSLDKSHSTRIDVDDKVVSFGFKGPCDGTINVLKLNVVFYQTFSNWKIMFRHNQ